jgi:hypothetical protein
VRDEGLGLEVRLDDLQVKRRGLAAEHGTGGHQPGTGWLDDLCCPG